MELASVLDVFGEAFVPEVPVVPVVPSVLGVVCASAERLSGRRRVAACAGEDSAPLIRMASARGAIQTLFLVTKPPWEKEYEEVVRTVSEL